MSGKPTICRERPLWRSGQRNNGVRGVSRNATEGVRYRSLTQAILARLLSLVMMSAVLSVDALYSRFVCAQDDWDAPKQPVNQPGARVVFAPQVIEPAQLDRWALGGKTRDQVQGSLESLLAVQIDSTTEVCGLSKAQAEKLLLAGRGDVKRFLRSVEQLKEKLRQAGQDRQKFNEIARAISPLQLKMQAGVFGDSSLYQRVLKQTLDGQQSARYEEQELQRRKFRYEAKIELALLNLEASVALRADQRQRLVKLLLTETDLPKKFGRYDHYLVLCQAGRLDEAKLKPIFDDAQWQTFKRVVEEAQRMERSLRLSGRLL